jgi:hemolysin activation/secretion protein
MGDRLIPQHEAVLGGLHTVRGYPEAVVAGDKMYVATFEYRFHLPRILRPVSSFTEEEREKLRKKLPLVSAPFRYRPDNVYGQPDWDLILRVFFDVGRVEQERIKPYEANHTIRGTGFGLELRIKSNISLRADYGITLDDVEQTENAVESGDDRVHGVITISF